MTTTGNMTVTPEHRLFGTAVWLELFAKRFADEWPETAQQALAHAADLKRFVDTLLEPSPLPDGDLTVDSGMSGDAVAEAELLWASLPTGNRSWAGLATHEKALVCHTLARFRSTALTRLEADNARMRDAIIYAAETTEDDHTSRKLFAALRSQGTIDAALCINCTKPAERR